LAKQYVYFKGKGSWFRHLFQLDDEFQKWHITLHFDGSSLEEFRNLHLKTHLKKDDDGYYAKLSRPRKKIMRGKEQIFDPPQVFDVEGRPMFDSNHIGNGSDITVKCELYQYSPPGSKVRANAIRLESVRIDNLVPYTPEKDYMPDQAKAAEGLMDQPAPNF
jgi:hypothetical protein